MQKSNSKLCESNSTDLATLAAVATASTLTLYDEQNFKSQINENIDNKPNSLKSDFFWIPNYKIWTDCKWLIEKIPQLKNFLKLLVEFYRCFSIIKLNDDEIGIFCSYLLFNISKFLFIFINFLINRLLIINFYPKR